LYYEELRNDPNEIFVTVYIDGIYFTDYMVSNYGRILSLKTLTFMEGTHNKGYVKIKLRHEGKVYQKFKHRIVAESFCANEENKPFVNHIDGNKDNNHPSNLEWVTSRENTHHAIDNGLIYTVCENSCFAKITNEKAHEICQLIDEGELTLKEIAKLLNVGYDCVKKIHMGKSWKLISRQYNFMKNR
jgi:hypothetical protein